VTTRSILAAGAVCCLLLVSGCGGSGPTGDDIAFVSSRDSYYAVYLMDADGSGRGRLTDEESDPSTAGGVQFQTDPAWSPDGTRIAFASNRSGNSDIWVANRDGSGMRQITNHPEIDTSPTWSPNGVQLAFVSGRSGGKQIYIVNSDGTGLQKLTSSAGDHDRPTWSKQDFIAFTSGSFPGHDISLYEVSTGRITVLTDGLGDNQSPAVSPTGRHVAFSTTRWGREQIAVINRRGQGLRRITTVGANQSPSWSGIR
jgi:tol-pal system beta propeller repeat protein TolB